MADYTFDPRMEVLLRDALRVEVARLPLTVTPEQVMERGASRRIGRRRGWAALLGANVDRRAVQLAGAATVLVVAAFAFGWWARLPGIASPSPSPSPTAIPSVTASPSAAAVDPSPSADPIADPFDIRWPQGTATQARDAEDRADAGDPAYTWQLDAQEVMHRFLREVLGWEQFVRDDYLAEEDSGTVSAAGALTRFGAQVWVRCAPGETNPLYPTRTDSSGGDRCAPTIDDGTYEAVTLRPWQFGRAGSAGVWVVTASDDPGTVRQVDPQAVRAQLDEFLAARVAGAGAEGYVEVDGGRGMLVSDEVPLLYAASSGARYERYELEPVGSPSWPYAEQKFIARLFADDGTIVVEQPIDWLFTRSDFGDRSVFKSNALATTENGRPAAVPYAFINGEVTVSAADPWMVGHQMFLNAALSREGIYGKERLAFVPDPLPVGVGCEAGPEPTDAAALAQAIQSDPDLQATSPVDAVIGGAAGMYMDISIAPGASLCVRPGSDDQGLPMVVTSTRRNIGGSGYPYGVDGDWGSNLDPADRMRLYLVNLPQGLTTRILAIAVAAPKDQFDEVLEAAAPVLQSIEFHAP